MGIEIIDCAQGTPEWYAARAGIITASEFHTVMAKGKEGGASVTRRKYMLRLAGEIITGEPAPEGFMSSAMERGKVMEAHARTAYRFETGADLRQVGFIKNGRVGASPDSLIGDDGGLEIKTAEPHVQLDRLLGERRVPPEHRAQVQGTLWVTGREWWDFVSYWPKLPRFEFRAYRDEAYIKEIAAACDRFIDELDTVVATFTPAVDQFRAAAA